MAAPLLYAGTQLLAGMGTPGYSFVRDAASELGRAGRPYSALFNVGAVATGLALLGGAIGIASAARGVHGRRRRSLAAVAFCSLSAGLAAIAAGCFPLPDPRHGGGPVGVGMFVAPFVVAVVHWRTWQIRPLLLGFMAAFVAGGSILAVGDPSIGGIGQRLLALGVFPALGVACVIARREALRQGS